MKRLKNILSKVNNDSRKLILSPKKLMYIAAVSAMALTGCGQPSDTTESQHDTSSPTVAASKKSTDKPNVLIFYVDDLGYGDIGAYGAKVATPNVDRLAAGGIRFTDAHSPAATCTPSRVSMLTGRYAFRNKAAILPGDAPLAIDHNGYTLPDLFSKAGYKTAVVGKWHLGLGEGGYLDWNKAVKPGPIELGFDYSFLMPATGDRVPTAYLENHHIVGLEENDPIQVTYDRQKIGQRPVGRENPELLKQQADDQHSDTIVNGISRIGYMAGGKNAEWVDEDFPFVFTDKAIDFIKDVKDQPFFLYFPFHDIHVPRVPNKMFEGKSGMGPRGDAILQMDWMTGKIVDALEAEGLLENTLILFSSDNGPVLDDGYADQAVELLGDHDPSGGFNGGKYSAFEAGTRVPMIAYYKGKINAGVSDALFSHIDFYASFADMLGITLKNDEAIDSQNVLPALFDAEKSGVEWSLQEAFTLGLRHNQWKYIAPFDGTTPAWLSNKTVDAALRPHAMLFNLAEDAAEQHNVIEQYPDILKRMEDKLKKIKAR
ncbi:sulfatase family protein [Agaribacter marinus]|uniref:Arylsulfatase n=1 Tax=Agaribacter marinus TaxID=1431249 RepID=A0AA37WJU9_9ALTE|nr:arylsulfatase [Agaribacter marinus]GLR72602.1 arylsulfatase [Agaribacter marinus]